MRVTKLSYGQTIDLGNFENEKIHLEVEINEGESPKVALDKARAFINQYKMKRDRFNQNNNSNNIFGG